ncbi:family with sequence similarity 78 member Ab [Callorhinchus milii]|uniref:Family with sequence similarity 78 member Ab n=1 Tax=Callorhinchus milii TaxID=7868 RepID=A0A4W3JHL4_CALMI|nr:family with sequence similarity 78 member Ab [Callorhinchus milii]|eukprot:gi/632964537/ref/XP_007898445.1/ PREDICTED: protein FAM78A [Callorhinchus milii]
MLPLLSCCVLLCLWPLSASLQHQHQHQSGCGEMGCINSITCKPQICRETISVYEVSASIDAHPTSIDESSEIVLRYRTPYFRASARVCMPPVPRHHTWVVGWIQACQHMEFYNQYGDAGMSSWELPDLRDEKIQAISDSDGVNYPWYGNTTETHTIVGPTKREVRFIVSMNDNFYPSVTWAIPVSKSNVAQLSSIRRDQSFTTWLVASNEVTSEVIVLQTVKWRMKLHIAVDPKKPLGQRAKLMEPLEQERPQILNKNELIPSNALMKPNANDAQVLMWRPKNGDPVVVIPSKH